MKKRLLAAVMTGLMAISTIMATPILTNAKTFESGGWWVQDEVTGDWSQNDIPVTVTTTNENTDLDVMWGELWKEDGLQAIDFYFESDSVRNAQGDILTIPLPISGTFVSLEYFDDDSEPNNRWSLSYGTNTITATCLEDSWGLYFYVLYRLGVVNKDNFWFEPMENELAIAASEVEVKGGTATAKISGDYALSYDIMKWLEDHPGVTLEYTLTYEGVEHLIVIPGGTKLANTEIPWYGPKYLIQYFEQK